MILYGVVITGLLFLAFAFFAVAQASTVRNGGQTAADAAALAAAQDDRDELFDGFLEALDDGAAWQDWLNGIAAIAGDGCGEADDFAAQNESDVLSCDEVTRNGDNGYTVKIETRFDTGKTFVPGADNKKARATATAVIKPLCDFDEGAEEIEITCDGEDFSIDPEDEDIDLKPADLFSVVLVD
ncbi:pilus assembly protein TadG-related protein [Streptomyces iconiensis]|uniref:pilus assembly protein TadG-related protein n=1 Tax=Streptomyces iconiensis TaxID=1384038 RepID=UPI0023613544